jgi:hypothetical protein
MYSPQQEEAAVADDLVVPASNIPAAQPTAAGIVPDVPIMRRRTYAATLSFVGITRRGTGWVRRVGDNWWKASLAVAALLLFLTGMYAVIAVWYVVIFGLFGVFTFPFRLVRRSHRKQEHLQRQQLATMQAMLVQQQQTLQQNKQD